MCLGGSGKAPAATPPPAPTPIPSEPQVSIIKGKSQLERLRYGLASTMKTGPRGLLDLKQSATPKNKLGA